MRKPSFRSAVVALCVVAGSLALPAKATAYGDPTIGCQDRVRRYRVGPERLYLTRPRTGEAKGGGSLWLYRETNGEPGLQRDDDECRRPGETHDTVVASSRILCTCDYPFGYPLPVP